MAPIKGSSPDRQPVEDNGYQHQPLAQGKIAEEWVNFDLMGMMQQIGPNPSPRQGAGQAAG